MTSGSPTHPRQAALPLVLAGAAFILTTWLVLDRMGILTPAPGGEPRVVTPRGELADFETDLIQIFEDNAPSVVHITTLRQVRSYSRSRTYPEGSGSGFLWDEDGTVITNYHVIARALGGGSREISVAVNGTHYEATVLNADPSHDIAVLRVLGTPRNLRPLPLGTSRDLRVGQFVAAIGNPFGLDQTLSTGVVSALNRTIQTNAGNTLSGVIQIDADINPGNSGGPLLDSAGRLIGMNTAIYSPSGVSSGIGFAVPVDTINEIVPELVAGRQNQRFMGIKAGDLRLPLPEHTGYARGVLVREVTPGEGAHAAGLRPYESRGGQEIVDIIVELEGKPVRTVAELQRSLRGRPKDQRVRVKILRGIWNGELRPVELMVSIR